MIRSNHAAPRIAWTSLIIYIGSPTLGTATPAVVTGEGMCVDFKICSQVSNRDREDLEFFMAIPLRIPSVSSKMLGGTEVYIVAIICVLFAQGLIIGVEAGSAHATFYGGQDASGTNNGACGYTNVFSLGYGTATTALSDALFNGGRSCGACYHIQCTGSSACTGRGIIVTATNECPQGSYGGWCDAPKQHFDMSEPAFSQIANTGAGVVPVNYYKTSCSRSGGIHFYIQGHTYYLLVLVYNVAGAGDLRSVAVKGSRSNWINMQRTWGVNWSTGTVLDGQALSFKVTTSDGKTSYSYNVAGSGWSYYQTFAGSNF